MDREALSVQHQARVVLLDVLVVVKGISHNGMAEMIQVHADLMSPTGRGPDFDKRVGFETLNDTKLRDAGLAAFGIDGDPA